MRRTKFIAVALLALFLGVQSAWGAETEDDREYLFIQGIISARTAGGLILNESVKVTLTRDTKYFDSKGRKSALKEMSRHKWLYVEGIKERDASVTAVDVYFLPGYINKKERPKYGFMQLP